MRSGPVQGPRFALRSAPAVLTVTYAVFVVAFVMAAVSTFTDTRLGLVPVGVAGALMGLVVSCDGGRLAAPAGARSRASLAAGGPSRPRFPGEVAPRRGRIRLPSGRPCPC